MTRSPGFSGGYTLRWLGPRTYRYVPDPGDPLTFTAADGAAVSADFEFDTDGATVPRPFWVVPGLDPWSFFPAAVIHDALWEMDQRGRRRLGFFASNRLLYDMCRALGYPAWKAWLIRRACDLFGGYLWLKH